MRKFFCPYCSMFHYLGPCIHVKRCTFDEYGNAREVEFRSIDEIASINSAWNEKLIAAEMSVNAPDSIKVGSTRPEASADAE